MANAKGRRAASKRAKTITKIAKKALAKDLYKKHDINILDCLNNAGFDARFMGNTVADLRLKIEE